jgi:carbon monoxide dehydrogenase subunit G
MIIEGKPTKIHADKKSVFKFLSDFNHYEMLMPDQIVNWKSAKDACSFTIKNMTSLALKFKNKNPYQFIDIEPDGKSPIQFNLKIELEEDSGNKQVTIAKVKIDADLNPMMAMVAKKPLENLVNIMGEKLNSQFSSQV